MIQRVRSLLISEKLYLLASKDSSKRMKVRLRTPLFFCKREMRKCTNTRQASCDLSLVVSSSIKGAGTENGKQKAGNIN